ncbi:uncharacterized protein [Bemisia tabaci]
MSDAQAQAAEYESSLGDLTVNSKPLINVLTMLAEENIAIAPLIVKAIENHIQTVSGDVKLPALYLVDSILKNVGKDYTNLFLRNLVSMFCGAFEKVDEKTRSQMFKLRSTWTNVLPPMILYELDTKVCTIDPAWPVGPPPPIPHIASSNNRIHLNPKFLNATTPSPSAAPSKKSIFSPTPIGTPSVAKTPEQTMSAEELKIQKKKLAELEELNKFLDSNIKAGQQQIKSKQQVASYPVGITNIEQLEKLVATCEAELGALILKCSELSKSPKNMDALKEAMLKKKLLTDMLKTLKRKQPVSSAPLTTVTSSKPVVASTAVAPHASSSLATDLSSSSPKSLAVPVPSKLAASSGHRQETMNVDEVTSISCDSTSLSKQQSPRAKSVAAPSQAPRVAISPASSLLINAAQRVRDPRLRKLKDSKSGGTSPPVSSPVSSPAESNCAINNGAPSSPRKGVVDAAKEEADALKPEKSTERSKDKEKRRKSKKSSKTDTHPSSPKGSPKTDKLESEESASTDLKKSCSDELIQKAMSSPVVAPALLKTEMILKPPQDVDLRVLPTSPKKRVSDNKSEEPPTKKNKAEMYNMLFGNEDVDLRQDVDLRLPVTGVPLLVSSISAPTQHLATAAVFDSSMTMSTASSPKAVAPVTIAQRPETSKTSKPSSSSTSSPKRESAKESSRPSSSKSKAESKKSSEKSASSRRAKKSPSPPLSKTPSPPPPPIISMKRDSPLKESTKENSRSWAKYKEVKPDKFKSPYRIPTKRFNPRLERPIEPNKLDHIIQHQSPLSYRSELDAGKETRSYLDNQHLNMNTYRSSYYTDMNHSNDISSIGERRPKTMADMKAEPLDEGSRAPEPYQPELRMSEPVSVKMEQCLEPHTSPKMETEPGSEVPVVLPEPPKPPATLLPPLPQPPQPLPMPQHYPAPLLQPPIVPVRPMVHPQGPLRHDLVDHPERSRMMLDHPERPRMMNHQERPRMMLDHQERHPFPRPNFNFNHHPGMRPSHLFVGPGRPPLRLSCDFAPTNPKLLEICALDVMTTINIDGVPREIRFYGLTAVVFLSNDDPREIRFQEGYRNVLFNDEDSIRLKLNDEAVDFELDGKIHKIRLGAPTRELYIDGKGFSLGWNTEPTPIFIDGKEHHVQLEGEPPPVTILPEKRLDLVAGKINLVVDGEQLITMYLDYKPQRFDIDGVPYVLQFMNALKRVKINNRVFNTDFGGKPKPFVFHGIRHFLRLSALPKGIVPGEVKLYGMEDVVSPPVPPAGSHPPLRQEDGAPHPSSDHIGDRPDHRRMSSRHRSKLGPQDKHFAVESRNERRPRHEVDKHSNSGASDGFSGSHSTSHSKSNQDNENSNESSTSSKTTSFLGELPSYSVTELVQKLFAKGMLGKAVEEKKEETPKAVDSELKQVDFTKPETLKVRQPAMITKLYSGQQCSTCGLRFLDGLTDKYSQHLDWHYRQNRRKKDMAHTVQSRQWYYDISDWIQFEEIEILEERAQSWFESQVIDEEGREIPGELVSVPAGSDLAEGVCVHCHDPFELFYHAEAEEWHFRHAICVDKKLYHPVCHQDWLLSLEVEAENARKELEELETKKLEEEKKKEEEKRIEEEKKKEEEIKKEDELKMEEEKGKESVSVKTEVMESDSEMTGNDAVKSETEVKVESNSDSGAVEELVVTIKEEPMEISVEEGDSSKMKTDVDSEATAEQPKEEILEKMETEESDLQTEVVIANIEIKKEDTDLNVVADSQVDTTYAGVTSSIDGNVELKESSQETVRSSGKIKINISKPVLSPAIPEEPVEPEPMAEESEPIGEPASGVTIDPNEPFPPGLEPTEPVVKLKPRLVGRKLTEYPPITKGTELSGLCSIM